MKMNQELLRQVGDGFVCCSFWYGASLSSPAHHNSSSQRFLLYVFVLIFNGKERRV